MNKLVRSVISLSILFVSMNSFAASWMTCGAGTNKKAIKHNTVNLPIYISAESFPTSSSREKIKLAIDSWNRSQTGRNNLNVFYAGINAATDLAVVGIMGNANFSYSEKMDLVDIAHDNDQLVTVYKRDFSSRDPSGLNNTVLAFVEIPPDKLDTNTSCATANTQQYFTNADRSSMDVVFNKSANKLATDYTEYVRFSPLSSVQPNTDLNLVAAHEVGHIVGLKHPDENYGFNGTPALMSSDYPHAGNLSLDRGQIEGDRYAKPMSDEILALRSLYANGGYSVNDVAVSQYTYQEVDNDPQRAWSFGLYYNNSFETGDENPSSTVIPFLWEGFAPVSVHNFGTSSENVKVVVGWWPSSSPAPSKANVWNYYNHQTVEAYLHPGDWIIRAKNVWGPTLSFSSGFNWRYHMQIWNNHETGDTNDVNDVDVSAKIWSQSPF